MFAPSFATAQTLDQPTPPSSTEINFDALLEQLDAHGNTLPTSVFERFQFEFDGMPFEVRRLKQPAGDSFLITATIGYLPFTIESPERRQAIRTIVAADHALPHVRLSTNNTGKITAGGVFEAENIVQPDFIFYPLMLFLQEARPFMQLIGQYLQDKAA